MKKSVLLSVAALVPFASASAEPAYLGLDVHELRSAVPASALLAEEVESRLGEDLGDIEDIVMNRDGDITAFLLDLQPTTTMETAERVPDQADDVDDVWYTRRDLDRNIDWLGEDFDAVQPTSIRYSEARDDVVVRAEAAIEAATQRVEVPPGIRVSEVIGMEVNLVDDDSFGRVEDVMISDDATRVVALVVDNWDGLEKHRRALPVAGAVINAIDEEVTYVLSEFDVEQIPDFNLDAYDEGWDVSEWVD